MKFHNFLIVIFLLFAWMLGCGKDSPTSPDSPENIQPPDINDLIFVGNWTGTTSQNYPISFKIDSVDSQVWITKVEYKINIQGGVIKEGTLESIKLSEIVDGKFNYSGYHMNVDGIFSDTTTLYGNLSARPQNIAVWDTVTYTAEKITIPIGPAGTLKWSIETGGDIYEVPAIGKDGTVYIGSDDSKLYAINPDGAIKWSFIMDDEAGTPSIGPDGTIYVGSSSFDGKFYAINPNGTLKWTFNIGEVEVTDPPSISTDGTIYFGSHHGDTLYALNNNGTLKWTFVAGGYINTSASIGTDGTIYIGSEDKNLYAINPNGTLKWTFTTRYPVKSSPAIGADGTIYFGSCEGNLYALNPEGTQKWAFMTSGNGPIYSSPAIGEDGIIYVGSLNDKLYAIFPDGTKKWNFDTGKPIYSSPAIGLDGTIYVGSNNGKLYAIPSQFSGTYKWVFETGDRVFSSPAIGDDGTLYVGSTDKKIYAIYSKSQGLAETQWPKFQYDNQNTANVTGS